MSARSLHVSLARQELEVREGSQVIETYPVSTAKNGPGFEDGSFCTPLGRFRICEKFGDGQPPETIFRSREPVGTWNSESSQEDDLVLARILRLDGLDEENSNSYERFIYIHGTNHEEQIGTPVSHGCVRMRNKDVVNLFQIVELETVVVISND